MKTILLPTDGSKQALKALDVAIDLAGVHGAALKVLHVLMGDKEPADLLVLADLTLLEQARIVAGLKALEGEPARALSAEQLMADPSLPMRPVPERTLREIGAVILDHAETAARKRDIEVEALPIATGRPAEAIVAAAAACHADTIVMGMRGLRQVDMVTLGSVSQQVCHRAACTCITVH